MSERNNLIKFGPEWLRNLSREGSAGTSNSTTAGASNSSPSQSASPGPGASNTASNQTAGAEGSTPSNTQTQTTKIQLAKLRYGREEMLALYDRNVEPPAELKQFELLFNSRGKPPLALTTNFEDDMRENMRGGPSTSGASPGERYGTGRGMHPTDSRGRGVNRYLRQQSIGRGASYSKPGMSSPMPGYGERGAEDAGAYGEASNAPRWNNNGGNNTPNRSSGEQSGDWGQSPTKPYRRWQPLANTNWRRTTREEGEEWRSGESTRTRPMQQHEKWDREWSERGGERSERGGREKPQWNTNRRTWSGDTQPSEDNLPEWAVDNMEPTAGTFDSSGAFHGYSNDDSNLPKSQGDNNLFQLTRSHTQGSFTRARTAEENEEWWASEKAKKLSPKRFDASEIKFKTPPSPTTGEPSTSTAAQKPTEEASKQEAPENIDKKNKEQIDKRNKSKKSVCFNPNLVESKTFDSPVRSEVTEEEDKSNDDRGNFKSVMITPNNSLRQRHQNIVSTANEVVQRQIFATQAAGSSNIKGILLNTERDGEPGLHPMTPNDNVVNSPMKFSFGDGSVHDMPLSSQPVTQSMHPSPIASTNVQQTMSNPALLNHGLKTNMPGLTSHSSIGLSLGSVNHSNMNMPSGSPSSMSMPTGNPSSMRMSSSNPIGMATATGNSTIGMATGNSTTGMATGNSSIGMATGISSIGMAAGNPSIAMATGNPSIGMATSNPSIGMNTGNHMGIGTGNPMAMAAGNPSMGMPTGNPMGLPNQPIQIPGIQSTGMPSQGMNIQGHGGLSAGMPQNSALGGFGSNNNPMAGMTAPMVGNNSLFMGQSTSMQSADVHGQQSQVGQSMYLVPGMQQPGAQQGFSSIYDSIIHASTLPPPPPPPSSPPHSFHDKWYYEDPKKMIQGPFHASDMCSWYRAGFFTSSLMVRRECDTHMRPLGSYGAVAPFMEVLMASDYYQRGQDLSRDPMSEPSAMSNMGSMSAAAPTAASEPSLDQQAQYSNVGNNFIRDAAAYAQQQSMQVESMWPASVWMQLQQPSETRQPLYYWDGQQSSAVGPNSLLPEKITKEMKTEDQILAQLRASQSMNPPQNPYLSKEQPGVHPSPNFGRLDEPAKVPSMGTPDLAELQKLMQRDASGSSLIANELKQEQEIISKAPLSVPIDYVRTDLVADDTVLNANLKLALQNKSAAEVKQQKASKLDTEKLLKNKDTTIGKIKTKKSKDDKKDDSNEIKKEDDIVKIEKPEESTTSKNKKEEKPNKKELEKEKKEWIKEGFTIVKGPEKSNKESKKKVEEVKVVEDADRKRKEEEKAAAEEEKARKQAELKKQQQQQRAMEAVAKKAPWSAQRSASPSRAGLTLAEIQKLEKEKKLEQIKEQQHMMQLLIRQQQQQQARELEMQAGLGWAKKKATMNVPEKSLAEIQAEARKQTQAAAVAAAAAAAQAAFDDAQASLPAVTVPWGSAYNGAGGFWDTERETPIPGLPSKQAEKTPEPVKQAEPTKSKKKAEKAPVAPTTSKKDTSLVHEFESWCNSVLASWSGKIDVPTFVGFLKDIESPYEVKDYVKCYLGETKHSDDFARQFLERRSKLLRAGTVTPADDLCSPAAAINPRPPAATEYQENKLKKSKKNKMLKVDARILGFSVTAAEDRINVGDIDSV